MTDRTQIASSCAIALAIRGHAQGIRDSRRDYPFAPQIAGKRSLSAFAATSVFLRDGFIDRYSGTQLVFPGVLRLLARLLPAEFPAHTNWKMIASHIIYWELFPTVDHVVPIARGGTDTADNWITTSMVLNSAKSNWTLDELRWTLLPPERSRRLGTAYCDGFSRSFHRCPEHLADSYIGTWHSAAKRVARMV